MFTRWLPDGLRDDRAGRIFVSVVAVVGIVVPALNLWVPEGSSFHVSTYVVTLLGKYMCYAILALAVDLIWGYMGILSLGHAAFFTLGGYAMGMYLMRQIGPRGVYGDPVLPDFMVFLNWDSLPWFWYGFDRFWFAMAMVAFAWLASSRILKYKLVYIPLAAGVLSRMSSIVSQSDEFMYLISIPDTLLKC
jgi:urea transport system permease protein